MASMIPGPTSYQYYSDGGREIQLLFVMCLVVMETSIKILRRALSSQDFSLVTVH
jgi:hypothetical protein